jgi:hypothetical protein
VAALGAQGQADQQQCDQCQRAPDALRYRHIDPLIALPPARAGIYRNCRAIGWRSAMDGSAISAFQKSAPTTRQPGP